MLFAMVEFLVQFEGHLITFGRHLEWSHADSNRVKGDLTASQQLRMEPGGMQNTLTYSYKHPVRFAYVSDHVQTV